MQSTPPNGSRIEALLAGLRRPRTLRVAAAGGAATLVAGAAAIVVTLSGSQASEPAASSGSAASTGSAGSGDPLGRLVDGYRVTFVPAGLRADAHGDGFATYPVSKDQLHNDGSVPGIVHATATATTRMYLRSNGGMWLWITVLRPERTTPGADRARVAEWLAAWAVKGTEQIEAYDVPAGRALLVRSGGSEANSSDVVIAAPAGTVITVGANAALPVSELRAVAAGIRPR